MLGHRASLHKFGRRRAEIIYSMFSEHNRNKLEINYRKISLKSQNIWKLKNILYNNPCVKEGIAREMKSIFK